VVDLLKIAKHGAGEQVYLIRFHYLPLSPAKPASNPEPHRHSGQELRSST
jgi:hypothetical protein